MSKHRIPNNGTPNKVSRNRRSSGTKVSSGTERQTQLAPITLECAGNFFALEPGSFHDPHVQSKIKEAAKDDSEVAVWIDGLASLHAEDQFAFFSLIQELDDADIEFLSEGDTTGSADLLEAFLERSSYDVGLQGSLARKSTALRIAAWFHNNDLREVCAVIKKSLKIPGSKLGDFYDQALQFKEHIDAQHSRDREDFVTVLNVLPDAPVSPDAIVPAGWELAMDGVVDLEYGTRIPAPIAISSRGKCVESGDETWGLSWFRDGGWESITIDRAECADARSIIKLAKHGVPVTSNNAKALVQYLADYETVNLKTLPVEKVVSRTGFHDGVGFVAGTQLVTPKKIIDIVKAKKHSNNVLVFRGADDGDDQLVEGFRQSGTYDGWRNAISPISRYPKAKIPFYASFAPPLLRILDSPNFAVDMAGSTSGGKTTVAKVAASAWGNPNEGSSAGNAAILSWKGTKTFLERAPGVLNHLPLVLDDTKNAQRPEHVAELVYAVSQGRTKGRGSIRGLAKSSTFQTVLISTGEQPLASFTNDGGVRARVLPLWGSPFGATDADTRRIVEEINEDIKEHHGHAGPRFVQFLLQSWKSYPFFREKYLKRREEYQEWAGEDPIAGRLAAHFAAIWSTMVLVHYALELPWEPVDPIDELWDEIVGDVTDVAAAALMYVREWVVAHQDEFFHAGKAREGDFKQHQPPKGWVGRRYVASDRDHKEIDDQKAWNPGASRQSDAGQISFIPVRLEEILRDGGFEPKSTIRTWGDRGWLRSTEEGEKTRRRVKARIGDETVWVIAILPEAFEEVDS